MSKTDILNRIKKAIDRKDIIPVIGNDLSMIRLLKSNIDKADDLISQLDSAIEVDDDVKVNLYDYLAFKLWNDYGSGDPPSPYTLNNVVLELQKNELPLDEIKNEIIYIVSKFTDEEIVLEPFRKLAKIDGLRTFLTVNFDNFLERAFEAEENKNMNPSVNFSIQNTDDTSEDLVANRVNIFNLMGNIKDTDFALTEEMSLEYLYKLQNGKEKKIKALFDTIGDKSILLVGCSFPNWFMRFFIRTISNSRFIEKRKSKYVASDRTSQDEDLANFLENNATKVFQIGASHSAGKSEEKVYSNSIEFIDELCDNLTEKKVLKRNEVLYKEKVFLSYSWDDKVMVSKLKSSFEANGVSVFFDNDYLETGARFADEIAKYIKTCDYFVAIISENSIRDESRYVYDEEWRRALYLAEEKEGRFIWPYIIDDTPPVHHKIPQAMRASNIVKIPSVDEIDKTVRKFIKESNLTKITTENE